MKRIALLAVVALIASPALAADLNVSLVKTSCTTERFPLEYEFDIVGQLSDTNNEGLAAVGLDLSLEFNGAQVDINSYTIAVTAGTGMDAFVKDRGLTNPAGYGGTAVGNKLVQIGGAQDTINNAGSVAPFPAGPVETGVGHTAVTLAHVAITLVDNPDVGAANAYTFQVDQVFGNVITLGETGPVYAVEALGNNPDDVAAQIQRFSSCIYDQNQDRSIAPADVSLVKFYYGCDINDPDPLTQCDCRLADVDENGTVEPADVSLVKFFYGSCEELE